MEWCVWIALLPCFVLYGECRNRKEPSMCKHGGYLKNVTFEGGEKSNKYSLIGNTHSMKECAEKCCHTKDCDLAMLKQDNKCFSVNCKEDESCRIIHMKPSSNNAAEIAFITKLPNDVTDKVGKRKRKRIPKKRKQKALTSHKNKLSNATYMNTSNDKIFEMLPHKETTPENELNDGDDGQHYIYVDQQKYLVTKDNESKDPSNFNMTSVKKVISKILSNDNNTVTHTSKTVRTNKMKKTNKSKNGDGVEEHSSNFAIKTETHSETTSPNDGSYHYSTSYHFGSSDSENQESFNQHNENLFNGSFKYPGSYVNNTNSEHQAVPNGSEFDYEGDIASYNPYHFANKQSENIKFMLNDFSSTKEKQEETTNFDANTNIMENNSIASSDKKVHTAYKPTDVSVVKPTKDDFVTEIIAELGSGSNNDEILDMSSGAGVEITADGTLVATTKNETSLLLNSSQNSSVFNSTKYQPVQSMKLARYNESTRTSNAISGDMKRYDNQESPSKYFGQNNTNLTISNDQTFGMSPWKLENYMLNNTHQYSTENMKSAFGDVGDFEIAPQQNVTPSWGVDRSVPYYNTNNFLHQNKSNSTGQPEKEDNYISHERSEHLRINSNNIAINNYENVSGSNTTRDVYNFSTILSPRNMKMGKIENELNIVSNLDDEKGVGYGTNFQPVNSSTGNNVENTLSKTKSQKEYVYRFNQIATNSSIYWKGINVTSGYNNGQDHNQYVVWGNSNLNQVQITSNKTSETVGESLFPKMKNNKSYVEKIREELESGSTMEDDYQNSKEEEKKEEKITKSIRSSYDVFGNVSKKKSKDTAVLLIAEELESGSGSGYGDYNEEEEEKGKRNEEIEKEFEEKSSSDKKRLRYDEKSENNASFSYYNPPIYEWKLSQGAGVTSKKNPQLSNTSNINGSILFEVENKTIFPNGNGLYQEINNASVSSSRNNSKPVFGIQESQETILSKMPDFNIQDNTRESLKQQESFPDFNSRNTIGDYKAYSKLSQLNYYPDYTLSQPIYQQLEKTNQRSLYQSQIHQTASYFKKKKSIRNIKHKQGNINRFKDTSESNIMQQSPTSRPEQVMKPVRNWSETYTEKPIYDYPVKDSQGKGLANDDEENRKKRLKFQNSTNESTTRRSTIWNKNRTKDSDRSLGSLPTGKRLKISSVKAIQIDKKPPKKSFLPMTKQSMMDEGHIERNNWLHQKLLRRNNLQQEGSNFYPYQLELPEIDAGPSYATYAMPLKHHRRKNSGHKSKHRIAIASDDEGAALIPIGRLPSISKKYHKVKSKDQHNKSKHKYRHSIMINTGIKADSLLGKMLTDDATSEITGERAPNPVLTAFATQMALTGTHESHKKHKRKYLLGDLHTSELIGFHGFPLTKNTVFSYKDEPQTNGFFSEENNLDYQTGQQNNDFFPDLGKLMSQEQAANNEQYNQDQNVQKFGQSTTGFSQQMFSSNNMEERTGLSHLKEDRSGFFQTQDVANQDVLENEQNVPYSEHRGIAPFATDGHQNAATLNVLKNLNGQDYTEAGRLYQRFNNDLSGLNDEISKIPGIAQITGIQTGIDAGSSPEVFAQRHKVANGGVSDTNNILHMNRFNSFENFNNFGQDQHTWLTRGALNNQEEHSISSTGKKKDKLLNPINLTETYVNDENQKESLLKATKFFIHEPLEGEYSWNSAPESALKINITDNTDESLTFTDDISGKSYTTSIPNEVNINNEQNNTVLHSFPQNKSSSKSPVSNQTMSLNNNTEIENTQLSSSNNRSYTSTSSNNSSTSVENHIKATLHEVESTHSVKDSNVNTTRTSGNHISWKSRTGERLKHVNKEGARGRELSKEKSRYSIQNNKKQTYNEEIGKTQSKPTVEKNSDSKRVDYPLPDHFSSANNKQRFTSDDESNWKEVVIESQYTKQAKEKLKLNSNKEYTPVMKSTDHKITNHYPFTFMSHSSQLSPELSSDHTMKRLLQESRKSSKAKQLIPNQQFFHALKEFLVSKLHSLNNGGDVMLNRDEPSSLLVSIASKKSTQYSNKPANKKKTEKQKKLKSYLKFESEQSRIVKDYPNKGASLLLADVNAQKKKKNMERKIEHNKYKENKKKKTKTINTQTVLDYNIIHTSVNKATHKKEKDFNKYKASTQYSRHHNHQKQRSRHIFGDSFQFGEYKQRSYNIDNSETNVAQLDDYNHDHPMMGHRYGDSVYESTHKWANHDNSNQFSHYGMHNNTADNHDNNDEWADKNPNNSKTPGQNLQSPFMETGLFPQEQEQLTRRHYSKQQANRGMEKEKQFTDKLTAFNLFSNSLPTKLNNLNAFNRMKTFAGTGWRTFISNQKRYDDMKQARVKETSHLVHKETTCSRGLTVRGATLRGGILSGEFKSMGIVDTQKECTNLCCNSQHGCDVAMTIGRECINIKCFNKKLCTIAPAGDLLIYNHVLPVVTFIRKPKHIGKRSDISRPVSVKEAMKELDEDDQEEINSIIQTDQYSPEFY